MRRPSWRVLLLIAVVAAALLLAAAAFVSMREPPSTPGPILQLHDGAIQGTVVGDVIVYRGVPFAAAPVGELRWRPPAPVRPWSGVLQATEFKPACMQVGPPVPGARPEPTSEDCLYLNLWVPRMPPPARSDAKLPVMVYLHGGGGTNGSASSRIYWGDQLAREGVITVNLSYRLGMLGWLAHPELTQEASYKASGNYAALDMVAGLRWVRDNIAAFGGDPGNVTVFGQSAGAFSASRLMTAPLAAGLFHKVIGQSGGDFYPATMPGSNASLADAERAGVEFARSLGVTTIDELRQLPADRIIAAPPPESQRRLPIIDGYVATADNQELYRRGAQQKIPLLLGYNELEGAMLGDSAADPPPNNAAEFIARVQQRYPQFAPRILAAYPAGTDEQARQSYVRLRGEEAINWNTATWARLHAASGQSEVYFYYFSQRPPFGPLRNIGATHGAELPYVFGFTPKWMRMFTQWPWKARQDLALTEQIPAYWTNFAKTGNPNGAALPAWPAYSGTHQVMHFGARTAAGPLPNADQHAVLDEYFDSAR